MAGLLRDKIRPSRNPPLPPAMRERTVALTLADPPGEATHWTAAMMAKAAGISVSSVQRIWRTCGLQPHRVRQFKLSRDLQFAAKLNDIVGLGACPRAGHRPDQWVDPPAHAAVFWVAEKSQIQSLPWHEQVPSTVPSPGSPSSPAGAA